MTIELRDAHKYILYIDNEFGGKLKYFGEEASPEFWDGLWTNSESAVLLERALRGCLPYALKKAFLGRIPARARVLEAGSGLGRFTIAMHARGFDAVGVDFAPGIIGRLQCEFPDIDFRRGDARNLFEFEDCSFDAVYSPGVSEHLESGPQSIFREANRILKPGGLLVNSSPWFNPIRRLRARAGAYESTAPDGLPFYQWVYSKEEVTSHLEQSGFSVQDTFGKGTIISIEEILPKALRLEEGRLKRLLSAGIDRTFLRDVAGHSCMWIASKTVPQL